MPVTLVLLPLLLVPGATSSAKAQPSVERAADTEGPWHLELELPLALATRRSASGARGEVAGLAGARASLGLNLGSWCLAGELTALLGLPEQQGSGALGVLVHDSALDAALRFGPRVQARGFMLHPYLRGALLAGLHLALLGAGERGVVAAGFAWGAAVAVGLSAGHGAWSLRWDLGVQSTTRFQQAVATLGLGYRW